MLRRLLGQTHVLDPVIELRPSRQVDVDPRTEGGVCRQEQTQQSGLLNRPEPPDQLQHTNLTPSSQLYDCVIRHVIMITESNTSSKYEYRHLYKPHTIITFERVYNK